VSVDDADAGAREVELLVPVDARELRRLAADQRAARGAADLGGPLHQLRDLLRVDPVGRDVVEEEERLRAAAEDVVDAVRGEVHAGPAELPRTAREHQLRADAVGGGRQESPLVERMEPCERSEAGGTGGLDRGTEPLDDRVGGRQRDSGFLVARRGLAVQELESTIPRRWTRRLGGCVTSLGASRTRRSR